jgi:chemotaxis regulatin CheY-phosphate phosphatase CheZ
MAWTGRRSNLPPRSAHREGTSGIDGFPEHQKAWEAFAVCAISMIPVLKKQMEAVSQQTERATMDLMMHISALTPPTTASRLTETSVNLSKIVMAMQFQDITQQKLEHVGQALDQWHKHLQALLQGPQDEGAKQEIAALQRLEESYTMEEERHLHAAALAPDYQEPVPIESEQTETKADSVTLF